MNHLAHLFLSQNDIGLMVGNFIADEVKGKAFQEYPDRIVKGIKMHREIDSYTDNHKVVKKSKERLYPKYHKYAPVIVDMFYDFILAKNWKSYSPVSLAAFADSVYEVLSKQECHLPERSKRLLFYLKQHQMLSAYKTFEGIGMALNGLSRRARFNSKMELAVQDLERDYSLYKKEFDLFFPELFEHINEWNQGSKCL